MSLYLFGAGGSLCALALLLAVLEGFCDALGAWLSGTPLAGSVLLELAEASELGAELAAPGGVVADWSVAGGAVPAALVVELGVVLVAVSWLAVPAVLLVAPVLAPAADVPAPIFDEL